MMFGRASLMPNLISLTNKTSSNRAATLADGVLLYIKIMDYANEIKDRLTLPEIARHYGFTPNRHGRMPCPFHNGNDPNLGLKDRYYNCFVCGAKGDAIKFVQELFGLNFNDTISKINSDFSLGLPIGQRIDRRKQLEMERLAFQRRQKAKQEEAERQQIEDAYWAAFDEWKRLDDNKRNYAPKTLSEPLHPLFVEALKNISGAEYRLECAEIARYEYEKRDSRDS